MRPVGADEGQLSTAVRPSWHGLSESGLPTISVVIPMRNGQRSIGACLDAILAQDYPRDLVEILVVDGASSDGSRAVVESYHSRHGQIRLLHNPAGSIPAGLNVGIRASRGAVIARVDARTLLSPDYLRVGVDLLRRSGASNVGGPVRAVTGRYWGRVLALVTQSRFGMGGAAVRYGDGDSREVDTVYLGLYPRSVLEQIGLYDEEMLRDQDDELNFRVRARGGRVLLSPGLQTEYLISPSIRRFASQNFLYGYWKVRVCQKHPAMASWRHLVAPTFMLTMLGGSWLTLIGAVPAAPLACIASLYAAGAIGSAAGVGRNAGWRYAPSLVPMFVLLHASWGLGFLVGFARFLPRWFAVEPAPPTLRVAEGGGRSR
jgi:cellulose synthase/poly-beta-1,6-N-acetylglucosamine synthase-like glycosyltransferase